MSSTYTYYSPAKGAFLNPGRARVLLGTRLNKEILKAMGYYPYFDPRANMRHSNVSLQNKYLHKGPIVLNGDRAVQTYTINAAGLRTLETTEEIASAPAAADDAAAATAGVDLGGFYFASGVLKKRLT